MASSVVFLRSRKIVLGSQVIHMRKLKGLQAKRLQKKRDSGFLPSEEGEWMRSTYQRGCRLLFCRSPLCRYGGMKHYVDLYITNLRLWEYVTNVAKVDERGRAGCS